MDRNFYMLNQQKILLIAKNLHQKGFENLKIIPSLSATGLAWRCSFSSWKFQDLSLVVSDWLNQFCDISEKEVQIDINDLTDKFIEQHKDFLEKCIGINEEYKTWFINTVEILEKEELPYTFSDYFGPTNFWKTSIGKKIFLSDKESSLFKVSSNDDLEYKEIEEIIKSYYYNKGYEKDFKNDILYLQTSFDEIKTIWLKNIENIEKINYIMIAEAPLWGNSKKYIYNPNTSFSQFFFKSDLEEILNISIADKSDFIKTLNSIGLLIIDISPFALNEKNTKLNYKSLGKSQYKKIIEATLPYYFNKKIEIIKSKLSTDTKVFFRYKRVKQSFENNIGKVLVENKIINTIDEIGDISKIGGGIDKIKLKEIIS